jgi:hypothetical protein
MRPAVIALPASRRSGMWMTLAALLCVAVVSVSAGCRRPEVNNAPLGARPSTSPNAGPLPAPDGETPETAAWRLFHAAYERYLPYARPRSAFEGATPGPIIPISAEYPDPAHPGVVLERPLVSWILPNDHKAVSGDMFEAMWPSAMKTDEFFVPMVKDGRVVFRLYAMQKNGHWIDAWQLYSIPPSVFRVEPYEWDTAAVRLREALGPETEVRATVLVPSGLVFAVGNNRGRQAAVSMGWTDSGKGIEGFHGTYPDRGEFFTQEELEELLRETH